jgi:hypothetical protein
MERTAVFADGAGSPAGDAAFEMAVSGPRTDPLVVRLSRNLDRELFLMKEILGWEEDERIYGELREAIGACLKELAELAAEGWIQPRRRLRLSPDEPEPEPEPSGERPIRLGVFPTSADPLHWMHLLGGLLAMSRLQLDKVVFIIAGSDPRKPHLLPAPIRHRIGRQVLDVFSPFLACSPIALGGSLPGEDNFFRLLQLNAHRKIQAFYLAGTDHYRRWASGAGNPDTLQRLEDVIRRKLYSYDERMHGVSAVFLDRGNPIRPVETFLDVKWIERLPLWASSTRIREAIGGRCALKMLAAVPFTVFSAICALRLYCPFSAASESCPHPADPSGVPGLDAQENCRWFLEKLRRRFGSSVDRRPDRSAIRISG